MEEKTELQVIIDQSGLEKSKAQVLLEKFTDYFQIAAEWEQKSNALVVNDISQTTEMKMADEARKFLKQKRIDIEKTRKELKEESLREGQTIDAIAKILKNLIEPIENQLEQKAKFKEIKLAEEKAQLKAQRDLELSPYSEFVPYGLDLGSMSDADYSKMLTGAKMQYEAKIEAGKQAERERLEAEQKERERIEAQRIENERLKKEAAEHEEQIRIEREQREAAELKARQEREAAEAEAKAERDRIEKEAAKKLAEEQRKALELENQLKAEKQKELDRIEAERKAKEEAEQKQAAELKAKQAADAKALKAPIKQQLNTWVDSFSLGKPISQNETTIEIEVKFESFKNWAKSLIEKI